MTALLKRTPAWKALLGVTAVLLLLTQFASGRAELNYEQTLGEALLMDGTVFPAGVAVQFNGINFVPSLSVTVRIEQPNGTSADLGALTDSNGQFTLTYNPPTAGMYAVTALSPNGTHLTNLYFNSGTTLYTSKADYAPGETVEVFGELWQPGETVSLVYHEEIDPPIHPDHTATAVADASGNIHSAEYQMDAEDAGLHFTLTASGQILGDPGASVVHGYSGNRLLPHGRERKLECYRHLGDVADFLGCLYRCLDAGDCDS